MISIIIADDHRLVAEGIARLIDESKKARVTAIARDLNEASQLLRTTPCDILLLDVAMPDGDGIDAISRFTKLSQKLRVIVLTIYAEPAVIRRAMDAGAAGYILKNTDASELIDGITVVADGDIFVSKAAQQLLIDNGEAAPELTPREREILKLVVEGLSMKEIADRLCLGFETVHSYTKYIRQKLGCNNIASLVRTAIERHLV